MTTTNHDSGLEPVIRNDDEPPQAFVQIRRPPKKTTWPWLIAGMVFIVMVSVVAGTSARWDGGDSLAGALAYGFGYSILPAMMLGFAVYLVLYFAVLKRSNQNNGGRYLAILVVTALLSGMAMSVTAGRIQPLSFNQGEVEAALDTLYAEQEATRTRFEQELAKADPEIFEPASLKSRGGYGRASAELERRRGLMAEAIVVNDAIGSRLRESMETAFSNPDRRRRFMAEFDAGYDGRRAEVIALGESQIRILDLIQEQLDFLRVTRWTEQDGSYVFYRQGDLDAFDARQAEIDRLTQDSIHEQERLDRDMKESRRTVAARLNRRDP